MIGYEKIKNRLLERFRNFGEYYIEYYKFDVGGNYDFYEDYFDLNTIYFIVNDFNNSEKNMTKRNIKIYLEYINSKISYQKLGNKHNLSGESIRQIMGWVDRNIVYRILKNMDNSISHKFYYPQFNDERYKLEIYNKALAKVEKIKKYWQSIRVYYEPLTSILMKAENLTTSIKQRINDLK